MIILAKAQKWDELEQKYPYQYIMQGAKLRALYFVQHIPDNREHSQHLWIVGPPGTGQLATSNASPGRERGTNDLPIGQLFSTNYALS